MTVYQGGLLEVTSVRKRFGGLHVFNDISFTIPPGEVLGIIGSNGVMPMPPAMKRYLGASLNRKLLRGGLMARKSPTRSLL